MNVLEMTDYKEKRNLECIDKISRNLAKTLPAPNGQLKMVVIIPAKNESDGIEKTLTSIINQIDSNRNFINKSYFEILVLCHNCSDATFETCIDFSSNFPESLLHVLSLNSQVANTVGAARRVLMNIASDRLLIENGLIISTDADTIAHPHWLHNLNYYLVQETALICGLINVDYQGLQGQTLTFLEAKNKYMRLKTQLETQLLPNPNDPWPRHSYHWGPNLAIKKHAYQAIGGIRPLHFLEDVDLFNRVVGQGFLIRHCMDVKVTTSTRTDARCDEGFGAELRVWTEYDGVSYNVEGIKKLRVRYLIYKLIMAYYKAPSNQVLKNISELAFIDVKHLKSEFEVCTLPEAMVVSMERYLNNNQLWHNANPNICVLKACDELNHHFMQLITD